MTILCFKQIEAVKLHFYCTEGILGCEQSMVMGGMRMSCCDSESSFFITLVNKRWPWLDL